MIIFKRNWTMYWRERSVKGDAFLPIVVLFLLFNAKGDPGSSIAMTALFMLPLSLMGVSRGVATYLIYEKESRQKEIQKIMGVT